VHLDLVVGPGAEELGGHGQAGAVGVHRHVDDPLLVLAGDDHLVVDRPRHRRPPDHRATGGRQRAAVGRREELRGIEDGVRETHARRQLLPVDRLALEAVVSGRERALELGERHLGERRLAALGEQLGQPEVRERPRGLEVHHALAVGHEDLELLPPVLGVGEHLETGVAVGRVVLDLQPGVLEGRRSLIAGCGRGGGHERHGAERDEAKPSAVGHGSSSRR
jgi:hypothetical protein